MQDRSTKFTDLPIDIISYVSEYLGVTHLSMLLYSATNSNGLGTYSSFISSSNAVDRQKIWKLRVKQSFPQEFSKVPPAYQDSHDWESQFKFLYQQEYRNLGFKLKHIFSLMNMVDIEGLKRVGFSFDDLRLNTYSGKKLLQVAIEKNNQSLFDYLFVLVAKSKDIDFCEDSMGGIDFTKPIRYRQAEESSIVYYAELFCQERFIKDVVEAKYPGRLPQFAYIAALKLAARSRDANRLTEILNVQSLAENTQLIKDNFDIFLSSIQGGCPRCVNVLIQAGANIFQSDTIKGDTVISRINQASHQEVLEYLIVQQYGFDELKKKHNQLKQLPDVEKKQYVQSLLTSPSAQWEPSSVAKLFEPLPSFVGGSVLHVAAYLGNVEVVQYLVEEHAADINAIDDVYIAINALLNRYDESFDIAIPSLVAASQGHYHVVEYFLNANKKPGLVLGSKKKLNIIDVRDILLASIKYGHYYMFKLVLDFFERGDLFKSSSDKQKSELYAKLMSNSLSHPEIFNILSSRAPSTELDNLNWDGMELRGNLEVIKFLLGRKLAKLNNKEGKQELLHQILIKIYEKYLAEYKSEMVLNKGCSSHYDIMSFLLYQAKCYSISLSELFDAFFPHPILILPINTGDFPVVRLLLENGIVLHEDVDIIIYAISHELSLVRVSLEQKLDFLKLLIDYSNSSKLGLISNGKIFQAILSNLVGDQRDYLFSETIKYMVENKHNMPINMIVNINGGYPKTLLLHAVENGWCQSVGVLLKYGADISKNINQEDIFNIVTSSPNYISPDIVKMICKQALLNYKNELKARPEGQYKTLLGEVIGKHLGLAFSAAQKEQAIDALILVIDGGDPAELHAHLNVLSDSKLGSIYKKIESSLQLNSANIKRKLG